MPEKTDYTCSWNGRRAVCYVPDSILSSTSNLVFLFQLLAEETRLTSPII